jgi:hypothetical protein
VYDGLAARFWFESFSQRRLFFHVRVQRGRCACAAGNFGDYAEPLDRGGRRMVLHAGGEDCSEDDAENALKMNMR